MIVKEIRAFVEFATPCAIVVSTMITLAFASLPILWAAEQWAMYWFPGWF